MRALRSAILAGVLPSAMFAQVQAANNKTYDAVVQGMACKQQQSGQLDCEYKVGKSLRFVIAGVGQQDVAVAFLKVEEDGDYFASIAPLHGCVVVKPGLARTDTTTNLAYVSPRDGKIYRNWNSCLKQPPKKQP